MGAWRVNMSQLVHTIQIPIICLWNVNKRRRHECKNIANNVCSPAIFISLKHKYLKIIFARGQRFVPVIYSVPFLFFFFFTRFLITDGFWDWPGTGITRVRKKPCKQTVGKVEGWMAGSQQLVNYMD